MIDEIKRVAAYQRIQKFNIKSAAIVSFIKMAGIHFTLTYPIKDYIPDDENDNYIVALALQSNSSFITSGDSHILSQKQMVEKKHSKLKIITKAAFEERF